MFECELDRCAKAIFDAKMQTGMYAGYPEAALELLRRDCERQAAIIIGTRWEG